MNRILACIAIHLYSGALESVRFILSLLQKKNSKIARWHLDERFAIPTAYYEYNEKTVIWIHAASLGEAKVIHRFLTFLEDKNPDDVYLLTAVTETGVSYLRSRKRPSVCAVGFMPLDTISLMKKILDRFSVSRIWLMETEIWPAMLWVCHRKDIPVGIFNARMEKKSYTLYHRFLPILKPLFNHLDSILAQDESYAERFKNMGARSEVIHITGNIKSRIIVKRPSSEQRNVLRYSMNLTPEDTIVTVGCLHPGEAAVIRQTIDTLNTNGHQWKWIIIPRHLQKTRDILDIMGNNVLHVMTPELSSPWNICLIEKMGIVEDMYLIADAAILGGTFIEVGGHNVWEAAQFGIPVFWGPDFHTQQASCERMITAGVGFDVQNAEELAGELVRVMKTDTADFINAQSTFMTAVNGESTTLESYLP